MTPARESATRRCPKCGQDMTFAAGQVWEGSTGGRVRIVSLEQDGAIVESVGRDEPRFAVSYGQLVGARFVP